MLDNFSYSELVIEKCDSLRSVPRMILSANCLQKFTLTNIPSLISFLADCFPISLRSLDIWNCRKLEFLSHNTWHKFTSLEILRIWNSCCSLTSISLGIFPALQELYIRFIPNLEAITTQGGESSPKLVDFIVTDFKGLRDEDLVNTLLKEQSLPTSLEYLFLHNFSGLKLLEGKGLQNLTSLQMLHMYNWPSFESLPEDQLPSSLVVLSLRECPLLEARYQSQNGKYWSKIAHIPAIKINEKVII
ncbi:unnamed protein product [Sphenostylis stenocarpa]|uniref:Uncharacterized protein n=1 Tax=Sphenostylis stenocarpa TaxID=92480 RepID=A0AA86T3R7_9FABA|nr:unnamed protein product [Sphenostylis stenocarpa]